MSPAEWAEHDIEIGEYRNAQKWVGIMLHRNPNDGTAYYLKAKCYYFMKKYDECISWCTDLLDHAEDDNTISNTLYLRAIAYLENADFSRSISDYTTIIDSYSEKLSGNDLFSAYINRGTALYHLEKYEAALNDYKTAQTLFVKQSEANNISSEECESNQEWLYDGIGYLYMKLERYQDAIDAFQKGTMDEESKRNLKCCYEKIDKK